jgi:uncharacterized Zn finger protein (UPF0148 family)
VRREAGVAWTETPGRDATDPLQGVAGMAGDFEVIFHGEIYASMDPVKVRSDMGRLFRQPAEKVHQLFDGRTWVLKDGLDRETAERYQVELAKIGVISELRDRSPAWKPEKPADPHSKSQNFTLESIAITRMTCPECQYAQLEADYCARCGTNIEVARAKAKLQAKEDDAIAQRIRQVRERRNEGADAGSSARPAGMVRESTREFHGSSPGPGMGTWLLVAVGLAGLIVGGLVASGLVSINL